MNQTLIVPSTGAETQPGTATEVPACDIRLRVLVQMGLNR
jgi:hypothetical protein